MSKYCINIFKCTRVFIDLSVVRMYNIKVKCGFFVRRNLMKQNAKKKLLIIFSVFLAIVILIVLGSTVFTLQKASLVFLHYDENTGETVYVDAPERYSDLTGEKLIEDFKGKSIFFLSGKKLISQTESNYPYIKVQGVNRLFPNFLEIFVTVREPVSVISHNGVYYLLDSENYVLEAFNQPVTEFPALNFSSYLNGAPSVGRRLEFKPEATWLNEVSEVVFRTLWQGGFDFVELPDLLDSVSVQAMPDYYCLSLAFNTGAVLKINDPVSDLQRKIHAGWSVYASDEKDNTHFGTTIEVSEKDGKITTVVNAD